MLCATLIHLKKDTAVGITFVAAAFFTAASTAAFTVVTEFIAAFTVAVALITSVARSLK